MILLLSKRSHEYSTDIVEGYLKAYNANYLRINGADLATPGNLYIDVNNDEICINNTKIPISDVKVVWNRRWYDKAEIKIDAIPDIYDKSSKLELLDSKLGEFLSLSNYFRSLFSHAIFIPKKLHINKLEVLKRARFFGIKVPDTFICTKKEQLKKLRDKYESIITKAIGDIFPIQTKNNLYSFLTVELDELIIESCEDSFYPSLIQNKIQKAYEVRTFYLFDKIYSMAIFSQNDDQTKIDFRNYNVNKPNRNVPFMIPNELESKIKLLMNDIGLNTGSIDFIVSTEGEYYFLEVNPVGQFGMVSLPCGYDIHKEIALNLIKIDKDDKY